jgi:hypothetical protein
MIDAAVMCEIMIDAAVMCENLQAPNDGSLSLSGTSFLSEAVYTCNFGFNLSSGGESFTRICQNTAQWSGVEPTCECE